MALSQRDSKWKDVPLGFSNDTTIGSHGCTISDIAMFAGITPDEVNRRLKAVGGYANTNLVIWKKISEAIPWLEFVYRHYSYDNDVAINAIKEHGAVLVEVDFDGTPRTDDRHWVNYTGNQKMDDPWNGKVEPTSKYQIRTGMAVLRRTDGKKYGEPPEGNGAGDGGCLLENTEENRATWSRIVGNSGKADVAVKALNLGENADNVSADTIKKSIAAKDGNYSACTTKLGEAEQEVKNREEQVSRIEKQLTEAETTYKAEYTRLNQQLSIEQERSNDWKTKYEQAMSSFDAEAKAKGKALNDLAKTQAKLDQCVKGGLAGLGFFAKLKLLFTA